jgi:hypothetical protein
MNNNATAYLHELRRQGLGTKDAANVELVEQLSGRFSELCKGNHRIALDSMLAFLQDIEALNYRDSKVIRKATLLAAKAQKANYSEKALKELSDFCESSKASGGLSDNGDTFVTSMMLRPVGATLVYVGLGLLVVAGIVGGAAPAWGGFISIVIGGLCLKGADYEDERGEGGNNGGDE